MPEIRILPDLLVNKIAAGEVIERPASVVKELLENAIDAGAAHIEVAIEDGGKRLIRVTDDGCGMSADQLKLAVTPHATSKINTEDDLYNIGTLGFRGEALASIGAVSHLRIVSRPADLDEGGEIRVAGESIESCSAAGCPPGTSIEVRDLFFNVPARRKFLRTTSTESGHVNEQFARIALTSPEIGFELINGKRVTQRLLPGQCRLDRIRALFGAEVTTGIIPIHREERGLEIEAYAAPPDRSRSNTGGQYLFVNGRYVRDRMISYAIREAYRGLLESDRFPIIYLFLTLNPAAVDANVHPTKVEVRWQDGSLVRSQVLSALRETFMQRDLTPSLRTDRVTCPIDEVRREQIRTEVAQELKDAVATAKAGIPTAQTAAGASSAQRPSASPRLPDTTPPHPGQPISGHATGAEALWRSLMPHQEQAGSPSVPPPAAGQEALDRDPATSDPQESALSAQPPDVVVAAGGRPAIQLHNTYLVTETEDGLVIIDQHALHERVIYDQLRRRLTDGALESQRLLLPETVEATPHQVALLQNHHDLLERLGVEVTPFGTNAVAVHSFPALLANADVRGFVRNLIDKLDDQGEAAHTEDLIHELLDMMACKAAVKAGDPLTPEEIDSLLAAKELAEKPSNCPHGRPTTLRLTVKDLEKQFKRT